MISFIARRLLGTLATLVFAAAAIFFILDLLPGDVARFMLGINASADAVANLRTELGLDAPAPVRFVQWVAGLATGDMGISYTQNAPVAALIGERLWVSLPLALIAMVLSVAVGIPMGIAAARHRGKPTDAGLMTLAQFGIAIPNFWFGMMLALVFAVWLGWLPSGGFVPFSENPLRAMASLVLPSLALALPQAAILARVMRTALVEVSELEFIRTAQAKGLTRGQAIWRHGVRNALLPVITILGLQFAYLVAGVIIVENVFYLPGLGRLIFTAISERDLILVRGITMILVIGVSLTLLITDFVYLAIDPRLRRQGAS
jgi:peptide/nickel transport system permease protein